MQRPFTATDKLRDSLGTMSSGQGRSSSWYLAAKQKLFMNINGSFPQNSTANSRSPIRDHRASLLFMIFLLVVSGVTASVVGYRVKSADLDRKAQLLKIYESYGGSFEKAHALGSTLVGPNHSTAENTFIAVYEVNCRARANGLYRVLETTSPEMMQQIVQSLFAIDATEAARSTEDALRAYQHPLPANGETAGVKPNSSPKAIRFAKQYDRYLARDTEVKLFRYVRDKLKGQPALGGN
jgi:hypothetical protein